MQDRDMFTTYIYALWGSQPKDVQRRHKSQILQKDPKCTVFANSLKIRYPIFLVE